MVKGGQELRLNRADNATYGSIKYLTGSGGLQLNDQNNDGITFVRGGSSESMRIDSVGRVTTPAQPVFKAIQSNLSGQNAGYKTVYFDDTATGGFDIGGNFNNSNDRFTAPVAGSYQFNTSVRCDGMNAYFRIIISKNGSTSAITNLHAIYGVPSGNYESLQVGGVLDLAANDYVTVIVYAVSDTSWAFTGEGFFTGFLIG